MIFNYMIVSMVALSALATGVAAPEFEAVSYDGRKITLSASPALLSTFSSMEFSIIKPAIHCFHELIKGN